MLDLLGNLLNPAMIENMKIGDALDKFPQAKELLNQYNLLEIAQVQEMQNLTVKEFAEKHNIDPQELINKVKGMLGQ